MELTATGCTFNLLAVPQVGSDYVTLWRIFTRIWKDRTLNKLNWIELNTYSCLLKQVRNAYRKWIPFVLLTNNIVQNTVNSKGFGNFRMHVMCFTDFLRNVIFFSPSQSSSYIQLNFKNNLFKDSSDQAVKKEICRPLLFLYRVPIIVCKWDEGRSIIRNAGL